MQIDSWTRAYHRAKCAARPPCQNANVFGPTIHFSRTDKSNVNQACLRKKQYSIESNIFKFYPKFLKIPVNCQSKQFSLTSGPLPNILTPLRLIFRFIGTSVPLRQDLGRVGLAPPCASLKCHPNFLQKHFPCMLHSALKNFETSISH